MSEAERNAMVAMERFAQTMKVIEKSSKTAKQCPMDALILEAARKVLAVIAGDLQNALTRLLAAETKA